MDSSYNENIFFVRRTLTDAELYAQLAEEAVELAHAALKYRRYLDESNPTPIQGKEAYAHFEEELADVLVALDAVDADLNCETVRRIRKEKAARWAARLEEKKMWGKTPPEAADRAFQSHDPARDEWFEEQVAAICRGEEPDLAPIVTDVWKQVLNNPDFTPKFPKVGVGYLRMEARRGT